MDVLVTGAAGFIGGHLTRALLGRGDTVTGVDRMPCTDGVDTDDAYTHHQVDLLGTDDRWRRAARRADAVVHLAARPGVRSTGARIERDRARDILGTTEAVLAVTPLATPLIVVSSSAVYGHGRPGRASYESDPLRPISSYGRWKAAAEARCTERTAAGGLVSVARPFTVAGPGQRHDMALSTWLTAALRGDPIVVLGGLDRSRDITDVSDVVEGLLALVDGGVAGGSPITVNLGAGRPRAHHEVVDAIARQVGRRLDVRVAAAHPADVDHTRADSRCFTALLGRDPNQDLDGVIRRQLHGSRQPVAA